MKLLSWFSVSIIISAFLGDELRVQCFSMTMNAENYQAPNFESFVGNVEGKWKASMIEKSPKSSICWKGPSYSWTVEEVMRPCGGAIQGIAERFSLENGDEIAFSPRRNDDGFIFMDSGSFSFGPAKLNSSQSLEYSFSSSGRNKRMRFKVRCSNGLEPQHFLVSNQVKESVVEDLESPTPVLESIASQLSYGTWKGEVISCTSYTPSCWINTRLKWTREQYSYDDEESGLLQDAVIERHLCREAESLFQPCQGVWMNQYISNQGVEIFAGYFNEETNALEAFLRSYDSSSGLLNQVQFLKYKVQEH